MLPSPAVLAEWLRRIEWVDRIWRLPWERLLGLYLGEKLALSMLAAVTFMGGVAAINRLLAGHYRWPKARKAIKVPKHKRGLGVKWLALALVAFLPGGIVGIATVYAVMGRESWRRDALRIVGLSLAPAGLLGLLRLECFPWPDMRDAVYISGLLGLVFGLLHIWALVKLLRQWWGEPDECVPWWPPAALCLQVLLLVAVGIRLLAPC